MHIDWITGHKSKCTRRLHQITISEPTNGDMDTTLVEETPIKSVSFKEIPNMGIKSTNLVPGLVRQQIETELSNLKKVLNSKNVMTADDALLAHYTAIYSKLDPIRYDVRDKIRDACEALGFKQAQTTELFSCMDESLEAGIALYESLIIGSGTAYKHAEEMFEADNRARILIHEEIKRIVKSECESGNISQSDERADICTALCIDNDCKTSNSTVKDALIDARAEILMKEFDLEAISDFPEQNYEKIHGKTIDGDGSTSVEGDEFIGGKYTDEFISAELDEDPERMVTLLKTRSTYEQRDNVKIVETFANMAKAKGLLRTKKQIGHTSSADGGIEVMERMIEKQQAKMDIALKESEKKPINSGHLSAFYKTSVYIAGLALLVVGGYALSKWGHQDSAMFTEKIKKTAEKLRTFTDKFSKSAAELKTAEYELTTNAGELETMVMQGRLSFGSLASKKEAIITEGKSLAVAANEAATTCTAIETVQDASIKSGEVIGIAMVRDSANNICSSIQSSSSSSSFSGHCGEEPRCNLADYTDSELRLMKSGKFSSNEILGLKQLFSADGPLYAGPTETEAQTATESVVKFYENLEETIKPVDAGVIKTYDSLADITAQANEKITEAALHIDDGTRKIEVGLQGTENIIKKFETLVDAGASRTISDTVEHAIIEQAGDKNAVLVHVVVENTMKPITMVENLGVSLRNSRQADKKALGSVQVLGKLLKIGTTVSTLWQASKEGCILSAMASLIEILSKLLSGSIGKLKTRLDSFASQHPSAEKDGEMVNAFIDSVNRGDKVITENEYRAALESATRLNLGAYTKMNTLMRWSAWIGSQTFGVARFGFDTVSSSAHVVTGLKKLPYFVTATKYVGSRLWLWTQKFSFITDGAKWILEWVMQTKNSVMPALIWTISLIADYPLEFIGIGAIVTLTVGAIFKNYDLGSRYRQLFCAFRRIGSFGIFAAQTYSTCLSAMSLYTAIMAGVQFAGITIAGPYIAIPIALGYLDVSVLPAAYRQWVNNKDLVKATYKKLFGKTPEVISLGNGTNYESITATITDKKTMLNVTHTLLEFISALIHDKVSSLKRIVLADKKLTRTVTTSSMFSESIEEEEEEKNANKIWSQNEWLRPSPEYSETKPIPLTSEDIKYNYTASDLLFSKTLIENQEKEKYMIESAVRHLEEMIQRETGRTSSSFCPVMTTTTMTTRSNQMSFV
jgi:hypothetical protein